MEWDLTNIRMRSTSRNTALADPIVLRSTTTTRLVFHPTVIENNPKNPEACVDGVFSFQRKAPSGDWENAESIRLSTLKAGEGVRLDLKSDEVHELFRGLRNLYEIAAEYGVRGGTSAFVDVRDSRVKKVVQAFQSRSLTDTELHDLLDVDFNAALSAARLRAVLGQMMANRLNGNEAFWQRFLRANSWVLSQVYADPLVIIQGQAYVGGKALDNTGGKLADYLLANPFTQNPAIVEIKTPMTQLLQTKPYRSNLYAPTLELTEAVAQLTHNRSHLKEQYRDLAGDEELRLRAFYPRGLLIVGTLSREITSGSHRRSFEQYRRSFRDLELITFDELAEKVTQLLKLLGHSESGRSE